MVKLECVSDSSKSIMSSNKKDQDIYKMICEDQWGCPSSDMVIIPLSDADIAKRLEHGDKYEDLLVAGKIDFYESVYNDATDMWEKGTLVESYTLTGTAKPYPYDAEGNFVPSMLD